MCISASTAVEISALRTTWSRIAVNLPQVRGLMSRKLSFCHLIISLFYQSKESAGVLLEMIGEEGSGTDDDG
jgi:hypothetical protein